MFYVRKRRFTSWFIIWLRLESMAYAQVKDRRILSLPALTYYAVLYSNLRNVRGGSINRA
jgi:hypothetical protein